MQIHELNTFAGKPGDLDFLPVDTGFDTAKISAPKLLEPKVDRPIDEHNQYDDGSEGQLLRSKGDGSTEWADVGLPTDAQTAQAVSDWLDAHPEATTTVQDGSITKAKISSSFIEEIKNGYVTPEMFGAVGDGATDDYAAFAQAIATGQPIFLGPKTYYINGSLVLSGDICITGSSMRGTVLEFADLGGSWCVVVDGVRSGVFANLTIKSHDGSNLNAIHFTNGRSSYTNFYNLYIDNVSKGLLIDTATAYNEFRNIEFILRDNNGIGIEIGSSNYDVNAIQPNYIYFEYCYFGNSVNFGANNYTDVLIHNCQHVIFTRCDFVAANRAIHFSDSTVNTRDVRIFECWFFAPFTIVYANNNKSINELIMHDNMYVVQLNKMKMFKCDGNTGYFNRLKQCNESIMNAGGSLDNEMYTINNFYLPTIENFINTFGGYFFTSNAIPSGSVYRPKPVRGWSSGSATIELYAEGLGYVTIPSIYVGAGMTYTMTLDNNKVTFDITGTGAYATS